MHQKHKNTRTRTKLKQLKSPGLVASYDRRRGNGAGLFLEEKISKGVGKGEETRISGEAYDVNKHTIYRATKSANESRAQYSPKPTPASRFLSKSSIGDIDVRIASGKLNSQIEFTLLKNSFINRCLFSYI